LIAVAPAMRLPTGGRIADATPNRASTVRG